MNDARTFTSEDAAYVARRLDAMGDITVDVRDYNNALRATLLLPAATFVAYWGLDAPRDTAFFQGARREFVASFVARSNFLDFVAACLATKLQSQWGAAPLDVGTTVA